MKPHERVAGLLRARRWAIAVLAGAEPDQAPALPRDIWNRFLELERCAAVLLSRVREIQALPAVASDTLRSMAATESQSALTARAEGRVIAEIASRLDFPVVVLKGGVRAVAGLAPTLPLNDIDILVPRAHLDRTARVLRDAGFGEPAEATRHHQGFRPAIDRLIIEVHWTTNDDGIPLPEDVWNRLRSIPAVPPLMQLGNGDHLEHVLRHAVSSHRGRSVAIRDLVLAGTIALECSDEELLSVRQRISGGHHAAELQRMLELSIALAAAPGMIPEDPFEREAAMFFAATVAESSSTRQIASPSALAFVTELAMGRTSLRQAPGRAFVFRGTGSRALARAAARFPGMMKPLLGAAHAGYYGVASALLLPRISRIAALALESVGPRSS